MRLAIQLFLIFFLNNSLFAKDTFIFSPLPTEDKKTLYNTFYPMISYLEKKLNKKIIFEYSDSYDEILKKFETNKIDLVYLGPLPYIELSNRCSCAIPLVNFKNSEGYTFYTCSFVSFLQNKKFDTIALTQPLSTCGYLAVNYLLKNRLKEKKYAYLGRHDLVALEVLKGNFDAGGIQTSIAKKYHHLGLEILSKTPDLPTFALIANSKTLDIDEINAVKRALIYANKSEIKTWGKPISYGAKSTKDSFYNNLRKMTKNLSIPQKGNF